MSQTNISMDIVKDYTEGISIHELALKYKISRAAMRYRLKKYGVYRDVIHLGKDIEERLAFKLHDIGAEVTVLPNNHPFDLLVGDKRVDVKSAHLSRCGQGPRYVFQLQDTTERSQPKVFYESVDFFFLVFLDEENMPVYALSGKDDLPKSTLSITNIENTKYNLKHICNLL